MIDLAHIELDRLLSCTDVGRAKRESHQPLDDELTTPLIDNGRESRPTQPEGVP